GPTKPDSLRPKPILTRLHFAGYLVAGLTLTGFLGGERGINWIGQLIRDRQNRCAAGRARRGSGEASVFKGPVDGDARHRTRGRPSGWGRAGSSPYASGRPPLSCRVGRVS